MDKNKTFYMLIIIPLILFLSLFFVKIDALMLIDANTQNIIHVYQVSAEDSFSMQWIHSVELEPWTEFFSVDDELNIVLTATKFKAFGAGVPHTAGKKTTIKNGFIIFSDINQTMPYIIYGISDTSRHTFSFNDSTLELYQYIEPNTPVKIVAKSVTLYRLINLKLRIKAYSQ
ncbi:MAG: DUF1850 domain-containing protein [Clostridiales bacterium]|nr:DUF1850 domain-containing protein [Clostridiales bacterium]